MWSSGIAALASSAGGAGEATSCLGAGFDRASAVRSEIGREASSLRGLVRSGIARLGAGGGRGGATAGATASGCPAADGSIWAPFVVSDPLSASIRAAAGARSVGTLSGAARVACAGPPSEEAGGACDGAGCDAAVRGGAAGAGAGGVSLISPAGAAAAGAGAGARTPSLISGLASALARRSLCRAGISTGSVTSQTETAATMARPIAPSAILSALMRLRPDERSRWLSAGPVRACGRSTVGDVIGRSFQHGNSPEPYKSGTKMSRAV